MLMEYIKKKHSKNLLLVHLVFCIKFRKKILYGELDDDIKQLTFDVCKSHHWYIKNMQTDKDHIHILLQYPTTDDVSKIVTVIKSYTTYYIWKRHSVFLSGEFWKERTFWSDGYFAASVGNASAEIIQHYIDTQG